MMSVRKASVLTLCIVMLFQLTLLAGCSSRGENGLAGSAANNAADSATDNAADSMADSATADTGDSVTDSAADNTADSIADSAADNTADSMADSAAVDPVNSVTDSAADNTADSTVASRSLPLAVDSIRDEEIERFAIQLSNTMSLEQKVAQMIMPAIRTWGNDRKSVTDLSACPGLAEALRRHQYGGLILFNANIVNTDQTVRLISDLQANNARCSDAEAAGVIPYLIAADQEGGSVARLTMGTRGTGSMAIGATGGEAERSALITGQIFGEELAALGINVNLGPCIDVITDLTDAGMSTRIFSDDPQTVAKLGLAFMNGVSQSGVITTFKHFPGAGDGSDYPTSIKLTPDQLRESGLFTFGAVIEQGAEMIMTSATTFPLIDDEVFMADGVTKGYYPATLSPGIVTGMLREELAFDGVVITDALEMEQFVTEPDNKKALFSGKGGSIRHDLQVAERAINAGCDILLIPADLNDQDSAQYYDDYVAGIVRLVEEGAVSAERIDESVRRILEMKCRHGLFDMDTSGTDLERKIETARQVVGSAEHHAAETGIAEKAITLLKNNDVLPLSGKGKRIVIIGRTSYDSTPVSYAIQHLMRDGFIDAEARIENRITGENQGSKNAETNIVIDHYYSTSHGGSLVYSQSLSAAIRNADAVVCLSAVGAGSSALQDSSSAMAGVSRALSEAHEAGAKFVLLSDNLPVDAARFQNADAIVCAYLSAGFGIDPTARTSGSENVGAFNANVPAAICAIFGAKDMPGKLPIHIPFLTKSAGGAWIYSDKILYERGYSASTEQPSDEAVLS